MNENGKITERETTLDAIKTREVLDNTNVPRELRIQCSICGAETQNGHPIPLVVDYIDGNVMNHSGQNMRLVCPNCASQLPTFRRKENKSS